MTAPKTTDTNAAIEALKAEFCGMSGFGDLEICTAIDRAVEISRRERVGTEEEVERVARRLCYSAGVSSMFRGFAEAMEDPREKAFVDGRWPEYTGPASAAISAMTPAAEVTELTAARAEIETLQVEVEAYEHAASYDPMMSGECRFKGWNRSQLDRARRITEGRRAREALRATKKDEQE